MIGFTPLLRLSDRPFDGVDERLFLGFGTTIDDAIEAFELPAIVVVPVVIA